MSRKIKALIICLVASGFLTTQAQAFVTPKEALFQETGVVPGQSISRSVQVENTRDVNREIGINFVEYEGDYELLGEYFHLAVKKEGSEENLYEDTFSQLFQSTQVNYFDKIPAKEKQNYIFTATFSPDAGKECLGKSFSFSILFSLLAEDETEEEAETVTVGGFGATPLPEVEDEELTIFEETIIVTEIGEDSVTIIWTTNYPASSQVIYAAEGEVHTLNLTDNTGTPPRYGYARTTPEYATDPRVNNHVITISNLAPGTTYYYRTVSHASFAISREYSFTTLRRGEVAGERDERPPVIDWRPEDEREVLGEEDVIINEEDVVDDEEEIIGEEQIELFPGEDEEEPEVKEPEAEESVGISRIIWLLVGILIISLIIFLLWRKDQKG